MKEELLSRMIKIYGFEHEAVIEFAALMETGISDKTLETLVKYHEAFPLIGDEDENE